MIKILICLIIFYGWVPKWSKGADCKSAVVWLRRFESSPTQTIRRIRRPFVILHRGQDKKFQESDSYLALEIDLRQYGRQLVVSHDEINPADAELLLQDVLGNYKGTIQIDVKCDEEVGLTAVDATGLYGVLTRENAIERVIITSWDLRFLEQLRDLDKDLKLGYDPAFEPLPTNKAELEALCDYLIDLATEMQLYMVCLYQDLARMIIESGLAEEFIARMREVGCLVDVWTVNEEEEVKRFLDYGFVVTTDLIGGRR